jgi:GrpB-like predicted nucleotidyltransferase (UPF0157 family)
LRRKISADARRQKAHEHARRKLKPAYLPHAKKLSNQPFKALRRNHSRVFLMGKSKKDLGRMKTNIKNRIAELEQLVRMDPLRKKPQIHEELAKLKKDLLEYE